MGNNRVTVVGLSRLHVEMSKQAFWLARRRVIRQMQPLNAFGPDTEISNAEEEQQQQRGCRRVTGAREKKELSAYCPRRWEEDNNDE